MKRLNILFSILIASLFSSSCEKYLDVNTDKSYPQETSPETLIAPIIFRIADGLTFDNRTINKYNQYLVGNNTSTTYVTNWERHGYYAPLENIGERMWRTVYYDMGMNLEDMIKQGKAQAKTEYVGIGYAIKAWAYQMLTDIHGPIILDEAFQEGKLTFKYQDQPEVYERVRQWCDSAIKYLQLVPPVSSARQLKLYSGDNIYQGDLSRWTKFVYGIKATQYGRLIRKPEFATRYADSVSKYVDLSFANSADDAKIRFTASNSSNGNPWGPEFGRLTSSYYYLAGTPILKYLSGGMRGEVDEDNKYPIDPRLPRMLVRASDSTFKAGIPGAGTNTGIPVVIGPNYADRIGRFIFDNKASFPIMSFAQLMFLKAEAKFIQGDKAEAHIAYLRGINGSMDFVNSYFAASGMGDDATIKPAERSAYLESTEVAQDPEELTISDIMGQKYVALWPWGSIETWSDLRKYNYDFFVFKQYHQISNLMHGDYAYRLRPRYYSEYNWNRLELEKWGGLESNYGVQRVWFATEE